MIRRLVLDNFMCFRGRHAIELGPGAYSITARHESDARRSNGLGKSAVVQAVGFALSGAFPRERGFDADGWIARGEAEGRVELELDSGLRVVRSKRRGRPRQVSAFVPGAGEATGDAAADAVWRHLGLDAHTFASTAYFEQKRMARLVHADPAERLSIVSGWLGLGLAERAEEAAAALAAALGRKVDGLEGEHRALLTRVNAPEGAFLPATEADLARAERAAADADGDVVAAERRARAEAVVEMRRRLVERGTRVRAEVEALDDAGAAEAEEAVVRAASALSAAQDELRRRRKVALGEFDGRCPVADIECPARARINEDRARADAASRRAAKAAEEAEAELARAKAAAEPKLRARMARAAKAAELARLRDEARAGQAEHDDAAALLATTVPLGDPEALQERARAAREELGSIRQRLAEGDRRAREAGRLAAEVARAGAELLRAEAERRRALAARLVFRAAGRRVAERALGGIEEAANAAVAEAGVDLVVRARWERAGKTPAKACEACGAPFPASARPKACARCGAERGLHQVPRLDFVLSDSSGALDDLAGIAWQLAAADWLLRSRESPWACAILDEPVSAFDQRLRHGLSRYLAGVARGGGVFRQLFVISHTSEIVDAMPGRIEVVCRADGSRTITAS